MKLKSDTLIAILNALVVHPHVSIKQTSAELKISPMTFYTWQSKSANDEAADLKEASDFWVTWMEQTSYWHRHVILARKLSILRIDSKLRDLAINGTREPLFSQGGYPVFEVDPKLAADALDPELWEMVHAPRPITDVFKRDADGQLVQVMIEKPPNPQLLIKAVTSLLPEVYGEKVEHSVQLGGVVRLAGPQPAPMRAIDSDFTTLVEAPGSVAPPKNVLAVAAPPNSVEAYEETFAGKRLIEATLFYDGSGQLQPPLPHVVIVEGSSLDRAYTEAGIEHRVTSPEHLIRQGYRNRFLLKLRPDIEQLCEMAATPPANPYPIGPSGERLDPRVGVPIGKPDDEPPTDRRDRVGAGPPLPGGFRVA
jgi:hypothetical protein